MAFYFCGSNDKEGKITTCKLENSHRICPSLLRVQPAGNLSLPGLAQLVSILGGPDKRIRDRRRGCQRPRAWSEFRQQFPGEKHEACVTLTYSLAFPEDQEHKIKIFDKSLPSLFYCSRGEKKWNLQVSLPGRRVTGCCNPKAQYACVIEVYRCVYIYIIDTHTCVFVGGKMER